MAHGPCCSPGGEPGGAASERPLPELRCTGRGLDLIGRLFSILAALRKPCDQALEVGSMYVCPHIYIYLYIYIYKYKCIIYLCVCITNGRD